MRGFKIGSTPKWGMSRLSFLFRNLVEIPGDVDHHHSAIAAQVEVNFDEGGRLVVQDG